MINLQLMWRGQSMKTSFFLTRGLLALHLRTFPLCFLLGVNCNMLLVTSSSTEEVSLLPSVIDFNQSSIFQLIQYQSLHKQSHDIVSTTFFTYSDVINVPSNISRRSTPKAVTDDIHPGSHNHLGVPVVYCY